MADYYFLLTKTIAGLLDSSPEVRRQIYERARQVLSRHLQNVDPPLSAAEIEHELSAFNSAVAQIEVELAVGAAVKTSPNGPDTPDPLARDPTTSAPPPVSPPQSFQDRSVEESEPTCIPSIGLRAHIRNNSLKSIFLIVGFPFVLPFVVFCAVFGPLAFFGSPQAYQVAQVAAIIALVVTLGMTVVWLPIAYFINQWIIDRATGARLLTRSDDLRVWNLLEKLCTRARTHMPTLRVIETGELNAYASGLSDSTYSVTVTKGLMDTLNDAELEAVLAHELTHILNRDVRLTVVATILVGIVPIIETIFVRGFWYFVNGLAKIQQAILTLLHLPGAVILIRLSYGLCFLAGHCFAAIVGFVSHIVSLLLNFSLSRRREFMADAGAVAITNNPDAMISALRKISGHSDIPAALANVREMFFDNPRLMGFEGFFATHPTIQARIDALLPYARATSHGQAVELSPSSGRWGDKAADLIGTGLLLCAIGTMSCLILTMSPNTIGAASQASRASQPSLFASPPPARASFAPVSPTPPMFNGTGNAYQPAASIPATIPSPGAAQAPQQIAVPRPSFDCARATHPDEKQICTIPTLANLDVLDSQAFKQALQVNHAATLASARKFIAARRICNDSAKCIITQQLAVLQVYRSLGATVADPQ